MDEEEPLIGTGNTAEIFTYDEDKICKLFFAGYSIDAVKREFMNAKVMEKMGLSVPVCFKIINRKNRDGIIYQRVYGKTLLDYFIETGDVDFLVNTLVNLHKKIINHYTNEVMSYKSFLTQCIKDKDKTLFKEIMKLPEGDSLCHGDYHPGNVLVDLDKNLTVIDFMNVCYGPREYDIARTYFLIKYGEIPKEIPNKQEIMKLQGQLADLYLDKMGINYDKISQFVSIISRCRKYEL